MWLLDLDKLHRLTPADQLWIIAEAMEENGGPASYVTALRSIAERLEDLGWWLAEPLEAAEGQVSIVPEEPR